VIVSALIADGPPSRVLEEVVDGRLELVVPPPVVAELEDVLVRKLGFESVALAGVRAMLERLATAAAVEPKRVAAATVDPNDDVILAFAVASRADVLVTGDRKHLLPLVEHRGVRLLTPQALLAELHAG
jgi:putative PIN family toxin of toxin-antitoxin system